MSTIKEVKFISIHHTAGPRNQTVESIRRYHIEKRRWADIGYSYVIDGKGILHEGRGLLTVGAHTRGYNSVTVGVAVIGDNTKPAEAWTMLQKLKLIETVRALKLLFPHAAVVGHGELVATACPGVNIKELLGDL